MATTSKPTAAQTRFLRKIADDGGVSRDAMTLVGDWRPIKTCIANGWATQEPWSDDDARVQHRLTDDGYRAIGQEPPTPDQKLIRETETLVQDVAQRHDLDLEPVHLHTGLGDPDHAVCGEPIADRKTAPHIADVTCDGCKTEYANYSIALRNELQRFANREGEYATEQPAARGAARQLGMDAADVEAVQRHLAALPDEKPEPLVRRDLDEAEGYASLREAIAVTDAYREVGGEVDSQTADAATVARNLTLTDGPTRPTPEQIQTAAGHQPTGDQVDQAIAEYEDDMGITRNVLELIEVLADGNTVYRYPRSPWQVLRVNIPNTPVSARTVEAALERHALRTHTNPSGMVTLHLPAAGPADTTLLPPPPEDAQTPPERTLVDNIVVAGRRVGEYLTDTRSGNYRSCDQHRNYNAVGYVVRWTVGDNGMILDRGEDGVGVDIAVFPAKLETGFDPAYTRALGLAKRIRAGGNHKAWAVVDLLWPCGHRS